MRLPPFLQIIMSERCVHPEVVNVLRHTLKFETDITAVFDGATTDGSPRSKLTTTFLGLAHEHWLSLRVLMAEGLSHSAIGLLRLQFEATLKGFWVHFVATDPWIEKASVIREVNDHLVEPDLPNVSEMLKDVERAAPPKAFALLDQFKSVAWRQLNSFVHGGMHALANFGGEFPAAFLVQIVANANGVYGLAATLAGSLSTDPQRIQRAIVAQRAHPECLPPFTNSPLPQP
ncbi:hypothetical protein EAH88_18655 [Rhodanobacter glycinis]|uniref:Uncharacterized protein n=2 Tax=Rhodanobacter glycinis TaxID=582702 RepID=A0A502BUG3_9GAMM|nr:hypothetical protein EAH88_18655 [Rhodanobacter glycinis]